MDPAALFTFQSKYYFFYAPCLGCYHAKELTFGSEQTWGVKFGSGLLEGAGALVRLLAEVWSPAEIFSRQFSSVANFLPSHLN